MKYPDSKSESSNGYQLLQLLKKRNIYTVKLVLTFTCLAILNKLSGYFLDGGWLQLIELLYLVTGMIISSYFLYKIILDSFCPRCKALFFGLVISRNACQSCGLSINTSAHKDVSH